MPTREHPGAALLSAFQAQRTGLHGDALLSVVNVSAFCVEDGAGNVSRAVWASALRLAFGDGFMVAGLVAPARLLLAALTGNTTNFTDRLKRPLTLFR